MSLYLWVIRSGSQLLLFCINNHLNVLYRVCVCEHIMILFFTYLLFFKSQNRLSLSSVII